MSTAIRCRAFGRSPCSSSATTAGSTMMLKLWRRRACWNGLAEWCGRIMMASTPHSGLITCTSDRGSDLP